MSQRFEQELFTELELYLCLLPSWQDFPLHVLVPVGVLYSALWVLWDLLLVLAMSHTNWPALKAENHNEWSTHFVIFLPFTSWLFSITQHFVFSPVPVVVVFHIPFRIYSCYLYEHGFLGDAHPLPKVEA